MRGAIQEVRGQAQEQGCEGAPLAPRGRLPDGPQSRRRHHRGVPRGYRQAVQGRVHRAVPLHQPHGHSSASPNYPGWIEKRDQDHQPHGQGQTRVGAHAAGAAPTHPGRGAVAPRHRDHAAAHVHRVRSQRRRGRRFTRRGQGLRQGQERGR